MQQQQRREQHFMRLGLSGGSSQQYGDFGRPILNASDSAYESGDSIDSTMAEDSCGSDSSSSDLAD